MSKLTEFQLGMIAGLSAAIFAHLVNLDWWTPVLAGVAGFAVTIILVLWRR